MTSEAQVPSWKAWTYQRRLARFNDINPEPEPLPLSPAAVRTAVVAVLDVRAGRRPARSLEQLASTTVLRQLSTAGPALGRLRRLRIFAPDPWCLEVAAVAARPERCCALALRWDWQDGRWLLTDVQW